MASVVKIEEAAGLAAERDEYLNNDDVVDLVNDDRHVGSDAHDDNLENYDDHDARDYDVTPSNPLLPQSMLASG